MKKNIAFLTEVIISYETDEMPSTYSSFTFTFYWPVSLRRVHVFEDAFN